MLVGRCAGANCSCAQSGDSASRLPGLVPGFSSCRDTLDHRLVLLRDTGHCAWCEVSSNFIILDDPTNVRVYFWTLNTILLINMSFYASTMMPWLL